jgi:phenylpyruvate tautomerase PptA (4-oxalocrotonate tautomerase family)
MPLVKIELKIGKEKDTLIKIRDLVMDCVVESLELPADEKNIRLMEYPDEFFQMKSPYEILIEITLFAGRKKETKRKLFQSIVHTLQNELGIEKEKVFILLNEQTLENWGVRGGIPADEVALNFRINI